MSTRKPQGVVSSIYAVRERVLSGARRILLAKMWLLDNGTAGCTAAADRLAGYTGLDERTVDDARRVLVDLGLVYRVAGTRTWHVTLPIGCPPDRASDAEVQAYARRIEEAIAGSETPSANVVDREASPSYREAIPFKPSPNPVLERGAIPSANGVEKPVPERGIREARGAIAASGLLSTPETLENTLGSDTLTRSETPENGNGASQGSPPVKLSELLNDIPGYRQFKARTAAR